MNSEEIKDIAIKKAMQSLCKFRISALGFNSKDELIYKATNKLRFISKGGGIHAEQVVMKRAGPSLSYIIICRVNRKGLILPIDPCEICSSLAKKRKIKIISLCNSSLEREIK